jgi:phage shock protein PspC (stress-responsive transcriptional regulator)
MMDKTIKINLAGTLFQIDEEAYHILRDYLKEVNKRFRNIQGGAETVEDIELRIAEIFQSSKTLTGNVTKENVEAMIAILGKPEDFDHPESNGDFSADYTHRRRLYRNPSDTVICGVSGGIGAYLNIDPVWIRVLFIVFTLFYGIGIIVYIALWIALPKATSDIQKQELFGENYRSEVYREKNRINSESNTGISYQTGNSKTGRVGNALNEIFGAIGKGFYILFRIFLIIFGICFVFIGFALLVVFVAVFFFRFPGFTSIDSVHIAIINIPDFLDFILKPTLTPWVMILTTVIVVLPLFALIYWGIKMIFWFKVRDGIISLIALILWIVSVSALLMILFDQGISFAETGSKNEKITLENVPDTLYLKIGSKLSDLKYDKELTLPHDEFSLYINNSKNELYGRPRIWLQESGNNAASLSVKKRSNGKIRREAVEKAESLVFNYKISNDTIYVDEYYNIPSKYKWTGADINVDIYIPKGKVIWIDENSEFIFPRYNNNGVSLSDLGNKYWKFGEDGLIEVLPKKSK